MKSSSLNTYNIICLFVRGINSRILVTLPWLLVASLIVFFKRQEMVNGGYRVSERALNLNSDTLSFVDTFSFYTADIMVCFGIIPFTILILSKFFSTKAALYASFSASVLALSLLLIQTQSQSIVGTTTSWSMVIDSIIFSINTPSVAISYINVSMFTKFGIAFLLVSIFFLGVKHVTSSKKINRSISRIAQMSQTTSSIFLLFILLFNLVMVSLNSLPSTNYHKSLLINYSLAFGGQSERKIIRMKDPSPTKLLQAYRQSANIDDNIKGLETSFGVHEGSDLIFIILETAPSSIAPLTTDNINLRNIVSLLPDSIYSNQHYSTFPYSNLAIFSLFTSWYSTGETLDLFMRSRPELPSFIKPLKVKGYEAKLYVPCDHSFEFDDVFYEKVGLGDDFIACKHEGSQKDTNSLLSNEVNSRLKNDKLAFDTMLSDIEKNHVKNQNYAYVFAPQIGHGPWPKVFDETTLAESGEALLSIQDEWVGELRNLLEKNNKLQDTIIVITGDHGIRTKKEDPTFPGNIVDDYSFRVPLVVHAPNLKNEDKRELSHNTSHIDVMPTILNLMGVTYKKEFLQGRSITLEPINRSIFFNAQYYLGADGYYDNGLYYSYNLSSGEIFISNSRLDFKSLAPIPFESADYDIIKNKIDNFYSVQNTWQHYYFNSEYNWEKHE